MTIGLRIIDHLKYLDKDLSLAPGEMAYAYDLDSPIEVDRNPSNRYLKFIATTDAVDADREVMVPTGADTTYFFKNRRIFVDHKHDLASYVGKLRTASPWPSAKDHRGWWIKISLFPNAKNALCDDLLTIAENGGIGTSLDYIPTEASRPTPMEMARYGMGDVKPKSIVRKWRWMAQSLTAIPSNAECQSIKSAAIRDRRLGVLDNLMAKGLIKPESAALVGFPPKVPISPPRERRILVCSSPASHGP